MKYFLFTYFLLGWLPVFFDKCGLNKKINKKFLKRKSLFTQSLFSFQNDVDHYPPYIKNRELYSKTIIVGGLEAKNSLENLEFLIGQQTLNDGMDLNMKKSEEDIMNI